MLRILLQGHFQRRATFNDSWTVYSLKQITWFFFLIIGIAANVPVITNKYIYRNPKVKTLLEYETLWNYDIKKKFLVENHATNIKRHEVIKKPTPPEASPRHKAQNTLSKFKIMFFNFLKVSKK